MVITQTELHLFPAKMPSYAKDAQQPSDVSPEYNFLGTNVFFNPTFRLFKLLAEKGYHIAKKEYNIDSFDECCMELVLVRLR